ncbi:unnamed protein product [Sympodiomycopsis kandeliae]
MPRIPRIKSLKEGKPPNADESPQSSEECLELGIQTEERAERLAYGLKSCKAFEKALEYYNLAIGYDDLDNKADALYNAARVYYVLGSSFRLLPDRQLEMYDCSVRYYRLALQSACGKDTDFGLDITSNLAAALHGVVKVGIGFDHPNAEQLVQMAQEAIALLGGVATEQESVLSGQLQDEQPNSNDASVSTQSSADTGDLANGATGATGADPGDDSTPSQSQYTSSLIVPSSLLDTYSTLHSIYLDMVNLTTTSQETIQLQQSHLSPILSKASTFITTCDATNDWGQRASPDDDWSSGVSEMQRAEIQGKVSVLTRLLEQGEQTNIVQELHNTAQEHLNTVQVMTQSKDTLANQARLLVEQTRKRTFWSLKLDEMIAAADQGVQLAILLLRSAEDQDSLVRLSWSLATTCSQLYLLSISLLDSSSSSSSSGSAVVLGSSESVNATTLLRCQIYTSLSDVNILRSRSIYTTLHTPRVVDDKSRSTILSNSKIYAMRGLNEIGLGSWLTTAVFTSKSATTSKKEIPPGGFDAIETQSDAVLTYLRSLYHSGQGDTENVVKSIRYLSRKTSIQEVDEVVNAWKLALDVNRWCKELIETEGSRLVTQEEVQFWDKVHHMVHPS